MVADSVAPPGKSLVSDVLTAVQAEIDRHKCAPLRCRMGFHKPSRWWVEFYAHVEVRRCSCCGCALQSRDSLTATSDPAGTIGMYKDHSERLYREFADHYMPHMNRGKATFGPG
jgi:hypothetical protein